MSLGLYGQPNGAGHKWRIRLFLALLLIMCHALKMLFNGFTAADTWLLVIEVMVLALISYEVISSVRHKRKMVQRVAEVFPFVERGQKLHASVPEQRNDMSAQDIEANQMWMEKFKAWDSETQALLSDKSSKAASIFIHVVTAAKTDRARWDSGGSVHYLYGDIGNIYQLLQIKLDNLHRIIENPDAYF